jgi:site-specific DNA-adenine methylase
MLERLGLKVADLLQQYGMLKDENEHLRNELMSLKAEHQIKDQEIARLIQENTNKDIEIEEIVNKIESMLG